MTAWVLRVATSVLARVTAVAMVAAAVVLPASPACAQDAPRASTAVSRPTVELGDSLIYQITLDGISQVDPPTLPAGDGWKAEFQGGQDQSSHSTMIINGKRTDNSSLKFVMQWKITPTKLGAATVESFTMVVGGAKVTVPRTAFKVVQAEANANFTLSLECDRTDGYIGEPIRMRVVWTLLTNVRGASYNGDDGGDRFDLEALDPRPVATRGNPIQNSDPYRAVPFLNGQAVISRTQATVDGRQVPRFVLDLVVTPRKEGTLDVGPFRVVCDEVVGQRNRGFFDSPFDDLSQTKRAVVTSNVLKLGVKKVPEEGKPAEFTGLVGRYSLEATAGSAEANVGDPVPLFLTIHGPEPLTSLKAPDLEAQGDFSSQFKPAPEGWEGSDAGKGPGGEGGGGAKSFKTTVRPKGEGITEIPPIKLAYFDTANGKYAVAKSQPIPLKVKASKQVTAADAQGAGGTALLGISGSGTPALLTDAGPSVGANSESLDALVDQRVSLLALGSSGPGLAFLLAPPGLLGVAAAISRRRKNADPKRVAQREALSRARGAIDRVASHGEFSSVVRGALSPFLGVQPDAVTARDPAMSGLAEGAAARATEILQELESAAFDGRSIDLGSAKERARVLFDELAKV